MTLCIQSFVLIEGLSGLVMMKKSLFTLCQPLSCLMHALAWRASWEPEKHLIDCGRLLTSFWNNIGFDNKDYHVGDEVIPTDEWIGTSFFYDSLTPILLTTFLKIEQESKRYAADKIANEKRRKNRNRSRSTNSPHEDANRNSEETQRLDDWKDAQQVADELFGDFEPEVNEISQPPPPEDKTMSTRISKKRKIQAESSSDDVSAVSLCATLHIINVTSTNFRNHLQTQYRQKKSRKRQGHKSYRHRVPQRLSDSH